MLAYGLLGASSMSDVSAATRAGAAVDALLLVSDTQGVGAVLAEMVGAVAQYPEVEALVLLRREVAIQSRFETYIREALKGADVLATGAPSLESSLQDEAFEVLSAGGECVVLSREACQRLNGALAGDPVELVLEGRARGLTVAGGLRGLARADSYAHGQAQELGKADLIARLRESARLYRPAVSGGIRDEKPGSYYGFERPEVAALVPASAERVLDIGCAGGGLGAGLKRKRPELEVCGVEYVLHAAEEARRHLDHVWVADLDDLQGLPVPLGYFDAFVCADVLEHLRNPEESLNRLLPYLSPSGVVVASIPNVKHWSVLLPLLVNDDFTYTDAGLLDRTHVHLFSLKEALAMMSRVGLGETLELSSVSSPSEHPHLLDPLLAAVSAYGADPEETRQLLNSYQFLLACGRAPL